jgi:nucleotide-binding universal stress UspA family protein
MQNLKRVCVGSNFSPESELAVQSAVRLARATGASVDFVHIVHRPALYERVLHRHPLSDDELSNRALAHLRETTAALAAGIDTRHHVRVGTPFAELIAACRELNSDLLVVGVRKRAALTDLLIGSTAERVLRKASVPVLLARRALPDKPKSILAPTDFSEGSRPALLEAIALARRWGARLSILHVIEPIVQS